MIYIVLVLSMSFGGPQNHLCGQITCRLLVIGTWVSQSFGDHGGTVFRTYLIYWFEATMFGRTTGVLLVMCPGNFVECAMGQGSNVLS